MSLKFENISKEKQVALDLLDNNKEPDLVEISDTELYLDEPLAIPLMDVSEEDLKEDQNRKLGIKIADDPIILK